MLKKQEVNFKTIVLIEKKEIELVGKGNIKDV